MAKGIYVENFPNDWLYCCYFLSPWICEHLAFPRNLFCITSLRAKTFFHPDWEKEGVPRVSPFTVNYLSLNIGISKNEDFDYVSLKFPMANLHNSQSHLAITLGRMQLWSVSPAQLASLLSIGISLLGCCLSYLLLPYLLPIPSATSTAKFANGSLLFNQMIILDKSWFLAWDMLFPLYFSSVPQFLLILVSFSVPFLKVAPFLGLSRVGKLNWYFEKKLNF